MKGKPELDMLVNERPIDIGYRSQLIHGAPSEIQNDLAIEKMLAQRSILVSQIYTLEEEAKRAIIERERWNARFNTMFIDLRTLYERHNQLIEQIREKRREVDESEKQETE